MKKSTILLVEDDEAMRKLVSNELTSSTYFELIDYAETCDEGKEKLKKNHPDFLLCDIGLKNHTSGIEVIQFARKEFPKLKIVVLTISTDTPLVIGLYKLGIDGYVSKGSIGNELHTALFSILRGSKFFDPEIAEKIRKEQEEELVAQPLTKLTYREQLIFTYLALGYQSADIMQQLKIDDPEYRGSTKSIYRKTKCENTVQISILARKRLLITDEECFSRPEFIEDVQIIEILDRIK